MDDKVKLTPSYNYLNSYEAARKYLETNPAFNTAEWNAQMQRGTLDSYIAVIDNVKSMEDYEAIKAQIPNFDYLDEDSKFMAVFNNYYGDNEKKKTQTYNVLNTETNQYEEKQNDFTDKEWTLKLLQDEANYNYEQAMAEIYEENRKNKVWIGKAAGQAEVAYRSVISGVIDVAGNLWNIVEGISDVIDAAANGRDADEAWRNAMKTRETDVATKALEDLAYNFEKEVGLRSYDGNLIKSAQFISGLGKSYGAILPAVALTVGVTLATGGAGTAPTVSALGSTMLSGAASIGAGAAALTGAAATAVSAATSLAKVYNALYWTSMASDNMNEMLNNPDTASISTVGIIANSITKTAFEFAIEKGLDAVLGSSINDMMQYGWSTRGKITGFENVLSKMPSGVRVAARYAGSALHEGTEELLQEFSGWFTDQVFAAWDEKFLKNSDWNLQVAFDAFLGGVVMSLAGSAVNFMTTRRVAYDVDANGKPIKLSKVKSVDYVLTMQDLNNKINSIDFEKMSVNERTRAVAGIYTSLRTMSSIFDAMGTERVENAFKFLAELKDITSTTTEVSDLAKQQVELESKIDKFISDLALDSKANKTGLRKLNEILKEQKLSEVAYTVNDQMTDDEFKQVSGHEAAAFKKIMEATGATEMVVTNGGNAPLQVGNTVIMPKNAVDSLTPDNMVKEVASINNLIKIQTDTRFKAALDFITPLYSKFVGKKQQSSRQAIVGILKNPEFVKVCLYQGNKITLRFVEDLKRVIETTDMKSLLGAKEKLDLEASFKMMSEVLTQYYIDQQTAPASTYETSAILSDEQKTRIRNERWSNDLANRIKNNEYGPKTETFENDKRLLIQRIVNSNMTAEEKQFAVNAFTKGTNKADVKKAFSMLEERYYYQYNSLYDGKTYFMNTNMPNMKANSFLEATGITIQTLLSNKQIDGVSTFDYYNNLFKETSYGEFGFIKDADGNIKVETLKDITLTDTPLKEAYRAKATISNKEADLGTLSVLMDNQTGNGNLLNADSKQYASIVTVNDLIFEPELLSDNIRNAILSDKNYGNLRPDTVFRFLKHSYLTSTDGMISIKMNDDGTYSKVIVYDVKSARSNNYEANCANVVSAVLDKQFSKVFKLKDFISNDFIDKNHLGEVSIKFDTNANSAYYANNTIYLSSKELTTIAEKIGGSSYDILQNAITNNILHEFRHAIDNTNNFIQGTTANVLSNFSAKNKSLIIADIRQHMPNVVNNAKGDIETIVNNIIYLRTGEAHAYGYENDPNLSYTPFLVAKDSLVTPWGSSYNFKNGKITLLDNTITDIRNVQQASVLYNTDIAPEYAKAYTENKAQGTDTVDITTAKINGNALLNKYPIFKTEWRNIGIGKGVSNVSYDDVLKRKRDIINFINTTPTFRIESLQQLQYELLLGNVSFSEFLDMDIPYVRYSDTALGDLTTDVPFQSIALGIDGIDIIQRFPTDGYLFYGVIKPKNLIAAVPLDISEGLVTTDFFKTAEAKEIPVTGLVKPFTNKNIHIGPIYGSTLDAIKGFNTPNLSELYRNVINYNIEKAKLNATPLEINTKEQRIMLYNVFLNKSPLVFLNEKNQYNIFEPNGISIDVDTLTHTSNFFKGLRINLYDIILYAEQTNAFGINIVDTQNDTKAKSNAIMSSKTRIYDGFTITIFNDTNIDSALEFIEKLKNEFVFSVNVMVTDNINNDILVKTVKSFTKSDIQQTYYDLKNRLAQKHLSDLLALNNDITKSQSTPLIINGEPQVTNEDISQYIKDNKDIAKEYKAINDKLKQYSLNDADFELISNKLGISIDELRRPNQKVIDAYKAAMAKIDIGKLGETQYDTIVNGALYLAEAYKKRKLIKEVRDKISAQQKVEITTEVKPDTKVKTKPEVTTETKVEAKSEVKTEAKPEVKTETKPEAKPKAKSEIKPKSVPIGSITRKDVKQYFKTHKDLNKKRNTFATKTSNKYYLTTYKTDLGKIQQFMKKEVGISETDFKKPTKSVIAEFKGAMKEKIKTTTSKKTLNTYTTMFAAGTEYLTNRFELLKFNTEVKQMIATDPDFVRDNTIDTTADVDEEVFDTLEALPIAEPLEATKKEIDTISDSRYISNEKAKGTLLEYYVEKNKPIYMDPNLQAVIIAASKDTDKLDAEFVARIKDKNHDHRLRTKSDLYNYIMNNDINEATFDLINRYYFRNENITSYAMLQILVNNAEKFYALRAALKALQKESGVDIDNYMFDPNLVTNFKQIITMIKEQMPETYKLYTQIRDRYEGKQGDAAVAETLKNKSNTHDVDRRYLKIILLNHFDGSLYSAGGAAAMAKILAWESYKKVGEVTAEKSLESTIKGAKADDDSDRTVEETIADVQLSPGDEDAFGFVYLNKDRYTKQRQLLQNNLDNYLSTTNRSALSVKGAREFIKEQVNKISNMTDAELDRALSASENQAITDVDVGSFITRRNIQQNIQQKAYRILAHLKTDMALDDYKRLIATYPELGFKEDGTWGMPNKGTEKFYVDEDYYNEETKTTEKRKVEKTRTVYLYGDELESLSDKLSQVNLLVRQGYFKSKSFAELVNIINKQKAQLERLKRKSITKVVEDVNVGKQIYSVEAEGPMPDTFKQLMGTTFTKLSKTKGKGLYFDERHTTKQYKVWLAENADTLNNLDSATANELLRYAINAKPYDTSFGSDDIKMFMAVKIFLYQYLGQTNDLNIDSELLLQAEKSLQVEQQLAGQNLTLIANALRDVNPAEIIYREMSSKLSIEFDAADVTELTAIVKQYAATDDPKTASIMLAKMDEVRQTMYEKAIKKYKGTNRNLFNQLWKAQRMFMLSSPGTWIRNVTANALVKVSNDTTSIIGDFVWKPLNALADKIQSKLKKKYKAPVKVDTSEYKQGIKIAKEKFDYDDLQDGDYIDKARKTLASVQRTFNRQTQYKLTGDVKFDQERYNNSKLALNAIEEDIRYYTKLNEYNEKTSGTPLRKTLTNQYKIVGTKVTPEYKAFIDTVIVRSGLLDTIKNGLNKYSDNIGYKAADNDLVNMIVKSIQVEIFQNNQFNSDLLNKTSKLLYKALSDDPYVNKKFVSYLGKILVENKVDISSKLVTSEIMKYIADAYSMAAYDYMHKPNFVNAIEQIVRQRTGKIGFLAYKQFFPFASASWNWFKEGLNYTPLGLAKAITDFAKLENVVNKLDFANAKGEGPSGRFASYIVKRNIGKGVIGSIGFLIGGMLGALGIAQVDEDDYDKKVKLRIGDVYIDISQIYGTTGIGLGMTIASAFKTPNTDFFDVLSTTLNFMFEESVFADVANLFSNNRSFGEAMVYEANGILSTFIPNIVKTFTSSLYMHKVKYSSGFLGTLQKFAVQSIPGIAYAMPKKYDSFTGELQYTYGGANFGYWLVSATNKLSPIKIEPRKISEAEKICISLGFNKGELTGKYEDIGEFDSNDKAKLNSLYGQYNESDLSKLLGNNTKYRVLDKKTGKYVELTFSKMNDTQKESVIKRIMNDNAKYAKVNIWTSNSHKYYAQSDSEYRDLLQKGITRNVYRPKKGASYVE